jgi:hypothetical protein
MKFGGVAREDIYHYSCEYRFPCLLFSEPERWVAVKDVIYPVVLVSIVNVALLISWTAAAPLTWIRSDLKNCRQ